jgi:hypothetical protein
MEKVARISPTVLRSDTHPVTLMELFHRLERDEARDNPDTLVDVAKLEMADADTLVAPDGRGFALNDWSRKQLTSRLGIRWERWFENASDGDVAEEMNRRMGRAVGQVKLRTRNNDDGPPELRAVVSSGYSPLPDASIARGLLGALAHVSRDPKVHRVHITPMTTTYFVSVGEPYRPGGHGDVGDVWGGLICRNSNTGFASLAVSLFLVRLVCRNGMTAPHEDSTVLRRVHRGLDAGDLDGKLYTKLRSMPARLRRGTDALADSAHIAVRDVDGSVRSMLQESRLPLRLASGIMEAYAHEPHATVFGVAQAITLAAQSLPSEERFELERAAGTYVETQLVAR